MLFALLSTQSAFASTPLPVIGHERTSAMCTLLHENVAQSVGDVLRDDATITQAGGAVDEMARAINEWGWGGGLWPHDPPNPGIARAELQLIRMGDAIEANLAQIDRLLRDPRFGDPASAQLASVKASLQRIAGEQFQVMELIFDIAYAPFPEYLTYYPENIQEQVKAMMRRAPRGSFDNMFASLGVIANRNIAETRVSESATAEAIMRVARLCPR